MGGLKEYWEHFVSFLKKYDAAHIMEILREADWNSILTNPLAWIATFFLFGVMIWKKQLKMLVFVCSMAAFVALLQTTLPPSGESMELSRILQFIGGSALLAGVNLYFLFVRQ